MNGATPTIDTLAAEGVKLNCVYGGIGCSPGRSQFLTGPSEKSDRRNRHLYACALATPSGMLALLSCSKKPAFFLIFLFSLSF